MPLPFSPSPNDFEGFTEVGHFRKKCLFRRSILAQSALVSSSAVEVQGSSSSPCPPFSSTSRHEHFLLQLANLAPPSCVDFLKEAYAGNLSRASAEVLVLAIRQSSRRQYQTAWTAFTSFIRTTKPLVIDDDIILHFMKSLFDKRGFASATVATYKSGLAKPLLWAFGLDLAKPVFHDFYRALVNLRPSKPHAPPEWSLEEVLKLLSAESFLCNPWLADLTQKNLFLLNSGYRGSH